MTQFGPSIEAKLQGRVRGFGIITMVPGPSIEIIAFPYKPGALRVMPRMHVINTYALIKYTFRTKIKSIEIYIYIIF